MSKYQYAQFGLIFSPFFFVYFSILQKVRFKKIIIDLIQNYLILFLSLLSALFLHSYLAELVIMEYNLKSEITNNNKGFILSVLEEKTNPLNINCEIRGFLDHMWVKFSAPAFNFISTNVVSMFFLVLLFLLRFFYLHTNKKYNDEYYFLFLLSLSTIFLYPIAIKTWCVNLRHSYDEIVNYLPILILVYIWMGNFLNKYLNKKYFIISIFLTFIFLNLVNLIV